MGRGGSGYAPGEKVEGGRLWFQIGNEESSFVGHVSRGAVPCLWKCTLRQ